MDTTVKEPKPSSVPGHKFQPRVYIKELGRYIGQSVTIRGWLYNKRSSGKIKFLLVRDGTGLLQCVMGARDVDEATFNLHDTLTQESSLVVTGVVREDKRSPGGFELTISAIEPVQVAAEYPIAKKDHGTAFLMDNRHLWLRSSKQHAIMRVRHHIIMAIRQFFHERDFTLIDTPILTGSIGEAASTLFETEYFDEGKAYLAQTGQLYVEAACMSLGKVYCFGPTFRAEKSKTRRHLTEFWMVEPEVAFNDNDDNMDLEEEFICYIVEWVLEHCQEQLATLERDVSLLERIKPPFPRLSYDEAVERLRALHSSIEWGQDLGGEDETLLTRDSDRPVFVYNYPAAAKAFYMKRHPERSDVVLCADLLAPEGYGEIIGGSQREDNLDLLVERIRAEKLPEEAYSWYLDLRRYGSVPHAGFGLGVERTVGWICGVPHVRETIPFPRTIGRLYP